MFMKIIKIFFVATIFLHGLVRASQNLSQGSERLSMSIQGKSLLGTPKSPQSFLGTTSSSGSVVTLKDLNAPRGAYEEYGLDRNAKFVGDKIHDFLQNSDVDERAKLNSIHEYLHLAPFSIAYVTPKEWMKIREMVQRYPSEDTEEMFEIVNSRPEFVRRAVVDSNNVFVPGVVIHKR